jgi:hypothetical protein
MALVPRPPSGRAGYVGRNGIDEGSTRVSVSDNEGAVGPMKMSDMHKLVQGAMVPKDRAMKMGVDVIVTEGDKHPNTSEAILACVKEYGPIDIEGIVEETGIFDMS